MVPPKRSFGHSNEPRFVLIYLFSATTTTKKLNVKHHTGLLDGAEG